MRTRPAWFYTQSAVVPYRLVDGSVEIVAQGTPTAVARMTSWAGRGPRHALVERVVVESREPEAGLDAFDIRR